jgi:hypothetical protein
MKILIVVSGMPALMLKKAFTYLSDEKHDKTKTAPGNPERFLFNCYIVN